MSSAVGTLARRLAAWAVLILVAVVALKWVVGAVVGFATMLVIGVVAVVGVVWALRHL